MNEYDLTNVSFILMLLGKHLSMKCFNFYINIKTKFLDSTDYKCKIFLLNESQVSEVKGTSSRGSSERQAFETN